MKQIFMLFGAILLSLTVNSQNFQWANSAGSSNTDMGTAITVDRSGNVYTIGTFDGTFDFDPGASTFTMSAGAGQDIFITKFSSTGAFIWAKQFSGTSTNQGNAIAVDASGNVYTTGNFLGTADFDPGVGTYTFSATGSTNDIFITKLDASGNFIWAKQMTGLGAEDCRSIVLDKFNNILITGVIQNTPCDFDPSSTSTYTLSAVAGYDIYVGKYSNNGDLIWVKQLGGSGNFEYGLGVTVDANNNVYSTGYFQSTADFDPGAGVYNLTASGTSQDGYVSKLDASGNFIWAKQLAGTGNEDSRSIAVDGSGNVYTTGKFDGVLDFDPSVSTYTLNTFGSNDVFISKLDVSGNFVWGKQLGGANSDFAYSVAVDACGNVYTTGFFNATADFDPGATTYNLTSAGSYDIFISKLNPLGDFVSVQQIGGTSVDGGNSVVVDANGSVYTTGWFSNTVDFDPGAGTSNLTSNGFYDIFNQKMISGSFIPGQPTTIQGTTSICAGALTSYSVAAVTGATSYSWSLPGGWTGTSTTNSISVTTGSLSGVVSVYAVNGCASSFAQNLNVTVNAKPVISVNSGTICSGSSFTLTPSGANTYTYSSGSAIVSPTTTTSYSVTGTSSAGCISASAAVSSVTVFAKPAISVNSGSICAGNSFTIIPNGASTYTFAGGSAIVSPTTTTSYSVVGTSTAGCSSGVAAISTVTVKAKPVVSVNSGSICAGSSFTIVPTGASTYSYSGGSAVVNPTVTTSYSVIGTSTAGCSSNPAVSSVTVGALPIISVSNNSICAGTSYTIVASGASTYTYSSGSAIVNPTTTTSYSVTGTSAGGCVSSSPAICTLTVNTLPVISVNSSSICSGSSFTIVPSGASTYTFTGGSSVVSPSVNTTYLVSGTSPEGCINDMSGIGICNVTVNSLPVISVNSATICAGNSFTIVPTGANTYTYSGGSAIVTPTANTTYSVTGTSIAGCESANSATLTIDVNALPSISIVTSNTLLCVGNTASLTLTGTANTYTWSTNENTTVIVISPSVTTTYTVIGTDANGCQNSSVITQSVSPCTAVSYAEKETLKIYPNPTFGLLTISASENESISKIELYNSLGEIMINESSSLINRDGSHAVIDLNSFSSGIYYLKINSISYKIIKE